MDNLPIKAILEKLNQVGISELNDVKLISPSYRNLTFQINTNLGEFCLQKHDSLKTKRELLLVQNLLDTLFNSLGSSICKIDFSFSINKENYTISKWINNVSSKEFFSGSSNYFVVGKLIGRIHQELSFIPTDNFLNTSLEYKNFDSDFINQKSDFNFFKLPVDTRGDINAQLKEYLTICKYILRFKKTIKDSVQLKSPIQLIHGDINDRNILVEKDWSIHLIDWEDVHVNLLHYDLAKALLYFCDYPNKIDNGIYFLKGYNSENNLSYTDINRIFDIAWYNIAIDKKWIYYAILNKNYDRFEFLTKDILRLQKMCAETNPSRHIKLFYSSINA